mmetsp:Transcript_122496/g.280770  ORF Transcript_122496/g.280770 Transcript_122496/m.280770 type:complete len:204 (-) Transcript_122496:34-645(-)
MLLVFRHTLRLHPPPQRLHRRHILVPPARVHEGGVQGRVRRAASIFQLVQEGVHPVKLTDGVEGADKADVDDVAWSKPSVQKCLERGLRSGQVLGHLTSLQQHVVTRGLRGNSHRNHLVKQGKSFINFPPLSMVEEHGAEWRCCDRSLIEVALQFRPCGLRLAGLDASLHTREDIADPSGVPRGQAKEAPAHAPKTQKKNTQK